MNISLAWPSYQGKAKLNSIDFALESAGPIEMKTYLN